MPKWHEREVPLARCPLPACRRTQTCRHDSAQDPCRRFHETQIGFYYRIAAKIDRIRAEVIAARPPGTVVPVAEEGTPEFERRYSALYRALRERDQENSAIEMATPAARRAEKKKPATSPKGA